MDGTQRPEIAMVSRLRVEVRGESMQAAEAVAFMALDHARLAGVLEGFASDTGSYGDHHFNRPEVTRKYGDGPEPWTELGLPYYGRLSFVFEPQSAWGGLRQVGFQVEREEDGPRYPGDEDHGYIVLPRRLPVTREHQWEVSPLRDTANETGESILADIRSIHDVVGVTAALSEERIVVNVSMDGWENVYATADTLREAAALARKRVLDMLGDPNLLPGEQAVFVPGVDEGNDSSYREVLYSTEDEEFTITVLWVGEAGGQKLRQKLRCVVREYTDASRAAVKDVYGMQVDTGEGADSVEDMVMRANGFIEGIRASREAEKAAGARFAIGGLDSLTEDYLTHLLVEASKQGCVYRTLFVGSRKALMIAARIVNQPQFVKSLDVRIDESLEGDQWKLTEEEVESTAV